MVLAQNDVCALCNCELYIVLPIRCRLHGKSIDLQNTEPATRVAVLHNIHNITYLHTQNMIHYTCILVYRRCIYAHNI